MHGVGNCVEYRPWSCFFFWTSSPADRELFPAGLRMELGFLNSFDRTLVSLSLQKPSSLRVVCIFYVKAGCLGRDGLIFISIIVIVIVSLHHRPALFLSAAATGRYASLLRLAGSDIALKASTASIPSHCNNYCAATTTALQQPLQQPLPQGRKVQRRPRPMPANRSCKGLLA